MKPSSSSVGTRPVGFFARYSGVSLPPNLPPTSTRSYFRLSSSQHQTTFCTLIEESRPRILSIASSLQSMGADEEPVVDRVLFLDGVAAGARLALHRDPRIRGERLAHLGGMAHFLLGEGPRRLPRRRAQGLHQVPRERVHLRGDLLFARFHHFGDRAACARAHREERGLAMAR